MPSFSNGVISICKHQSNFNSQSLRTLLGWLVKWTTNLLERDSFQNHSNTIFIRLSSIWRLSLYWIGHSVLLPMSNEYNYYNTKTSSFQARPPVFIRNFKIANSSLYIPGNDWRQWFTLAVLVSLRLQTLYFWSICLYVPTRI